VANPNTILTLTLTLTRGLILDNPNWSKDGSVYTADNNINPSNGEKYNYISAKVRKKLRHI